MKNEDMEPGKTYHSTHHMCMSIEGLLHNYKIRKINFFTNDDGLPSSDKEARKYLAECQEKGWKKIPFGEPCEGFDYFGKGCPGHLNYITTNESNGN